MRNKTKISSSSSTKYYVAIVALLAVVFLVAQMFWVMKNQRLFLPFSVDKIKCMECGSTGVVRDQDDNHRLVICPICFGVGGNHIRRVDENDFQCPVCEGMGRVLEDNAGRTCKRCDGRGLIRNERWFEEKKL